MREATRTILSQARAILAEYQADDITLTLRQLYYQFVIRALFGSGLKNYKRLGAILVKARLSGEFPIDGLEDRLRTAGATDATRYNTDVDWAFKHAPTLMAEIPRRLIYAGRWIGQPTYVSVWCEKDALASVFEVVCTELGVGLFCCKGYSSLSALSSWLVDTAKAGQHPLTSIGWKAKILYFGDHDPDGFEIPRSAARNMTQIAAIKELHVPFEFERVALNIDQIREHNPPPFAAKTSSTRYQSYFDEHGIDDAWELDALDPRTLRALIRQRVEAHFVPSIWDTIMDGIRFARGELAERMSEPEWMSKALSSLED